MLLSVPPDDHGTIWSTGSNKKAGLGDLIEAQRTEIHAICQRNGASNVYIFGSAARGEASATSDVDFLVDLDSDRSLLDHIGLQQELEDLL